MTNGKPAKSAADWWRGAVIYQIYPRSFADTNGDGVGDLPGITAKLDYVAALGVDAIWLSPFFKSPMKDYGYDVEDYCDVDPLFGTLADFDALVAKAHGLGLKVMIDQVISHTADTHPWFKESRANKINPKADWFVWSDAKSDGSAPNNWLSIFGGSAWAWDTRRCQYYLHNFLTSQPDLNFHNKDVREALYKTIDFWLKRGVDGFRHDTVNYYVHDQKLRDNPPNNNSLVVDVPESNPYGYQQHIYDKSRPENLEVMKELRSLFNTYPNIAAVGEVGAGADTNRLIAQYTSGGDKMHMCYGFDLLSCKDNAAYIRHAVEEFEAVGKAGWICWALSNHDVIRAATRWNAPPLSQDFAPLSLAMLTSLRGSQCIYNGEELGLSDVDVPFEKLRDPYGIAFWPEMKSRDGCRTPIPWTDGVRAGFTTAREPWLPIPEDHRKMSVARQSKNPKSGLNRVKAFLAWRKTQPLLLDGDIHFHAAPEPLLVFSRSSANEALLCVFNLRPEPVSYEMPVAAEEVSGHGFHSTRKGTVVNLPGYGAFFGHYKL